MTTFKRYSVQILGTVDSTDAVTLHQTIKTALGSVEKFNIKAISLDEWTDGFSGKTRTFDEAGNEILPVRADPQSEPKQDQEIVEVTMQ